MADIVNILAAAAGAAGTGVETDPNFNQTVLLLHGDGTDGSQNNTFLDSGTANSGSGFTITRNGNATQGTFSPFSAPDGRWSNYFDGSGDYLSIASDADFAFGTGDFALSAWIYPTTVSGTQILIECRLAGSAPNTGVVFYLNGATLTSARDISNVVLSGGTVVANQWQFVELTRTSGDWRIFLNGTAVAGPITNTTNFSSNSPVRIGTSQIVASPQPFNGYMSNVRILKGTGGSTSTVPTSPISTSTTNQKLLTCYGNRFADFNTATTAKTITVNGDPKVTSFSPLAPTAAYDASVNGGSGYFDQTTDSLNAGANSAFDITSGNFTVEMWLYRPTGGAEQYLFSQRANSPVSGWEWRINATNFQSFFFAGGSVVTGLTAVPTNSWVHLAVTRSTNTVKLFINGVEDNTATFSNGTSASTVNLLLGAGTTGGGLIVGYCSNARILKGTAIDFASTGIPTAPLTNITNTSLLLNFTNAGIFDQTGKNNLETVGNAQIDTTTKKYGTGSMEFDGTGDWLKVPNSPDLQLGTGDFTIEFWVYLASGDTGSARGLVAKGGASTGWLVSLDSSEKVVFTYTTSTITSSGAITTNAWNHIAVVREGTGSNETKIYIGGTNDGTGTVSTDFNQTEVMYIGANRAAGDPMKGFIDDLRITKGVARYTTTFTPPTKAFPDL